MKASIIGYGLAIFIAFSFLSSVTYIYYGIRYEERVDERAENYGLYELDWSDSDCRQAAEKDVQEELGIIVLEGTYIVFTLASIAGLAIIIWGLIAKPDIKRFYGMIQHPNNEITNVELFISNIDQKVVANVREYKNVRIEKIKVKK